jgi:transcriptional regulator with XRE-family HTH domain
MGKESIKLRIKDIIREQGLTLNDIAEKTGKKVQYISNIVNGRVAMSLNSLIMMADVLDVEFADLFARDADRTGTTAESELMCLFKREVAFPSDGSPVFGARIITAIYNCFNAKSWKSFVSECQSDKCVAEFVCKCKQYLEAHVASEFN